MADEPVHTTQLIALDDRPADTGSPPFQSAIRLVCLTGDQAGQVFRVAAPGIVIGRGPEVDVSLTGHDVSRRHAQITWHADHAIVEDLGSRNGIAVNGLPVRARRLEIGDRLQIGVSTILVVARADDLEQRAIQLQKLDALAALAGGMVHDFRNTLGVIATNAELLAEQVREELGEQSELLSGLRDILAAATAGVDLTQRLQYFAQQAPPTDRAVVRLAEVIDEVAAAIRRPFQLKHRIELVVEVDPALRVRAHRDQLHHALLNLCVNARDAMPVGGTLTVHARGRTFSRADALGLLLPAPGHFVDLTVTDTGVGMTEATQARVFEPFFTTKKQGTGLGLSTVYGVVRNHGGNILVESEPGRTCFRILLPSAAEQVERAAADAVEPVAPARRARRVLVVEDDADLADSLATPLRDNGYEVDIAPNGRVALERMRAQAPDAVLLDLMLPEVDGWRVVQVMHGDPALASVPICVVSAYADRAPSLVRHTLTKPVSLAALLAMVDQLCAPR